MTRVPELQSGEMSAEQKRISDEISAGPRGAVVGPLAVWLHRPGLADTAQKLGQYCRYDSSLPPRLSELAILTTGRIWDAAFEWDSHVGPARKAGLSEDIIRALAEDREPVFENDDESAVYRVTRTLNFERAIPNDLYMEAEGLLGKDGLVDLIGVLGYYSLISMTIKAFEVPGMNQS